MKRISIDPFKPASIDRAILRLLDYKRWLKERVDRLCEVLAKEYALYTVANEFGYTEGGSVVCVAEELPGGNGWVVRAEGAPVFFLEYGTGPAAGTGPILGQPPVSTAPGSYSASHGQTYQAWVDGGMQGPYRFTLQPRGGMYYAFRAATDNVQRVAEEVFRD